jgi:hypothetical protein
LTSCTILAFRLFANVLLLPIRSREIVPLHTQPLSLKEQSQPPRSAARVHTVNIAKNQSPCEIFFGLI